MESRQLAFHEPAREGKLERGTDMRDTYSLQGQVQTWVNGELEGVSEVSLPALRDRAVEYFKLDPTFMDRFMTVGFRQKMYDWVQAAVGATRTDFVKFGSSNFATQQHIRAKANGNAIAHWMELIEGKVLRTHKKLIDMTNEDLRGSIKTRNENALEEHRIALYFESLRTLPTSKTKRPMEGAETVGECWSGDDLVCLFLEAKQRAERQSASGTLRVPR